MTTLAPQRETLLALASSAELAVRKALNAELQAALATPADGEVLIQIVASLVYGALAGATTFAWDAAPDEAAARRMVDRAQEPMQQCLGFVAADRAASTLAAALRITRQ